MALGSKKEEAKLGRAHGNGRPEKNGVDTP